VSGTRAVHRAARPPLDKIGSHAFVEIVAGTNVPKRRVPVIKKRAIGLFVAVLFVVMTSVALAATFNGTPGNDGLIGTAGDDIMNGFAGNDRIFGLDGKDVIHAGPGRDFVGGDGTCRPDQSDISYCMDEPSRGPGAADQIFGEEGDDTLSSNVGNDRVSGGPGNDRIISGLGDDRVFGGPGNDRLSAADGNDFLSGGSGADLIFGGDGRDRLKGGSGRDVLRGGNGRDRIEARDGQVDDVGCGRGLDFVIADTHDKVHADCEVVDRP
jgi:Ca2+-binding RTX toxin-like protein